MADTDDDKTGKTGSASSSSTKKSGTAKRASGAGSGGAKTSRPKSTAARADSGATKKAPTSRNKSAESSEARAEPTAAAEAAAAKASAEKSSPSSTSSASASGPENERTRGQVEEALFSAADAVSEAAESFARVTDAAAARRAAAAEGRLGHIAYLLYALTPITGVTCVAGLMLALLRRGASGVSKTLLESHYNWLIWTFWYGLAASVISGLLSWAVVYVGGILFALTALWMIWRVTKGWLTLYDGKAMANPMAAL